MDARKGSVFIVALWSLCLLTTFVVYSGLTVRQKLSFIDRLNKRDSMHFIGEAGVNSAILELRRKDVEDNYYALNEAWSNNPSSFKDRSVGVGSFTISYVCGEKNSQEARYGILDETGKININTADAKVIARLLEKVARLNEQRALSLAHCIIDWRDKDSFFQHPQYGAEDSDYRNLDEPYEAKDSEFEVKKELLLIIGMDQEIFESIKDFITVYGEDKVNINTAPRQVFLALGLSDSLIQKILLFRKGEDQIVGSFDDNIFTNTATIMPEISKYEGISIGEIAELSRFIEREVFVTSSTDFMIICSAKLNTSEQTAEITAVANQEGFIRYWQEVY